MANINDLIDAIRTAEYGRDVRGSIADGIEAINEDATDALNTANSVVANENTRVNNENTRVASENTRVASENSRVTAESGRVTEFNAMKTAYDSATHENTVLELTDAREGEPSLKDNLLKIKARDGYINASVFEVVGDGVADDTTFIQTADDYSVVNNITIVYPRKTYKITGTLNIRGQHDMSYATVKATTNFEMFNMFPSGVIRNTKVDITGATEFTNKIFSFNTATYQAWLDHPDQRFTNLNEIEIYSGSNTGIGIGFTAIKNIGATGGWYISGVNISNVKIYGAIGKGLSFHAEDFVGDGGDYTSAWCDHNQLSNIQFYNNKKSCHIYGKANNNQLINYIMQNDNPPVEPSDLPDIAIGKCWDRAEVKLKNMDYAYGGNYIFGGMSPAYFSEPDGIKLSPVMSPMFNRSGLYTDLCGFKTNDLAYNKGDLLKGTYYILDEFDGAALSNKWRLTALNNNTSAVSLGATVRTNGRHLKGIKLIPATTVVGDYVQMDMGGNTMLSKDLTFDALITFSPIDWASYGKWQVGFYQDSNNYILLEKDERNYTDNTVLFKCKAGGVETVKTLTFGWNYTYTLFKAVFSVTGSKVDLKLSKEWQGSPTQGSSTNMWVTSTNTQNLVFENITTNIPSGLLQPYFRIECNQTGQNTRLYVHSLEVTSRRLKTQ